MKRLILIRHGETDYTSQRKYCGHEDIPLNAQGVEQAKGLRDKLKNVKAHTIYSSDLRRAFETAKIAFQKSPIIKERGLREIDFGHFSGLTFEEVNKLYPAIYRTWIKNPINTKIPKGESFSDFVNRIEGCFEKISSQTHEKTVALISHGGPIRIILLKLLQKNFDEFWSIEIETAAINIIDIKNG